MNCKTSIENCKGILWFSIYKTDVVNKTIKYLRMFLCETKLAEMLAFLVLFPG